MHKLIISELAKADLRAIWHYSFQHWGEKQADRYLDALQCGFKQCAEMSANGRRRNLVRTGYWSLLIRRHVAFYTVSEDEILIQRVLHGSMEPTLHLPEDEDKA